ncbi:MAG: NINE protein [Clostridia bacterium]|nr:NINE protein [Clostridia bacterium]
MGLFNTHICKNCFSSYTGKPDVCPHCGAEIEYKHRKKKQSEEEIIQETAGENQSASSELTQVPQKKTKKRHHLSDQDIMDTISFEDLIKKTNDKDVKSWRERKKKREREIDVKVDKDGQFDIDTRDVTYLPQTHTYSAKKARGEYKKEKIKWWEVYKWADVLLARRKIKKQVSRASRHRPEQFSLGWTITLCVLFGWMGAHNFYVRNWRKGLVQLICGVFGAVVVFEPVFAPVRISIGGGLLFVDVMIWMLDLINLIIGQFSYRLSKWKFIDSLNTDTRATLGFKYIDRDEYKKLWIVRVFNSIKRSIVERKEEKLAQRQKEQSKAEKVEEAETQVDENATDSNTINIAEFKEEQKNKNNSAKKSQNKSKNAKKGAKVIKFNKSKKK